MSRAANTLITSDVLTTPIKLKYSSTYDSSSYYNAGIRVLSGVNGPVTSTGSLQRATLTYRSVRHLFYSNYLTGSYPISESRAFNWEQSTAAYGTDDVDNRVFPTGSGDRIKILSLPSDLVNEKISRRSFILSDVDRLSYMIMDDGNGNLVDVKSDELYVTRDYFTPNESDPDPYVLGMPRGTHVGNIVYSQGIIIITNSAYLNVLDEGPLIINFYARVKDTEYPKTFSPLTTATAGASPINTASLALIPIPSQPFPNYSIVTGSVYLSPADALSSTVGSYIINYSVSSSIGTPCQSTASIYLTVYPDCDFNVTTSLYTVYSTPTVLYDFSNRIVYSAATGSTFVPQLVTNPAYEPNGGTFVTLASNVLVGTTTAWNNYYTAGWLAFANSYPTALRDYGIPELTSGTEKFTIVAWCWLKDLGFPGTRPGILTTRANRAGQSVGWSLYYDGSSGIAFEKYNSALGGAAVRYTLPWTSTNFGGLPYNTWIMLYVNYDGTNTTVGCITNAGNYNVISATPMPNTNTSAGYGRFIGSYLQSNLVTRDIPNMQIGYLAIYNSLPTNLTTTDIESIYYLTRASYGY